jgi:hypothetical protein
MSNKWHECEDIAYGKKIESYALYCSVSVVLVAFIPLLWLSGDWQLDLTDLLPAAAWMFSGCGSFLLCPFRDSRCGPLKPSALFIFPRDLVVKHMKCITSEPLVRRSPMRLKAQYDKKERQLLLVLNVNSRRLCSKGIVFEWPSLLVTHRFKKKKMIIKKVAAAVFVNLGWSLAKWRIKRIRIVFVREQCGLLDGTFKLLT